MQSPKSVNKKEQRNAEAWHILLNGPSCPCNPFLVSLVKYTQPEIAAEMSMVGYDMTNAIISLKIHDLSKQGSLYYQPKQCITFGGNPNKISIDLHQV